MKRFVFFVSLTLILAGTIWGQTSRPSQDLDKKVVLTGTAYDINHAVIPFAKVVARSFGVNEYQATTNDEGVYKIELPLDVYRVEVNAPGFCPKRVEMFAVRSSRLVQRRLDFVLQVSEGDRPCRQKTMIREPKKTRQPELFRSIAE